MKIKFEHFKKLFLESILSEGKHWPEDYKKTAINTIKKSSLGRTSWYSDDLIKQDVDTFISEFGPLSHKNSNFGYFATIIKWFVEYADGDAEKYQEFIEQKLDTIIRDLLWLSNSPEEELKIKDELKSKWSFDDFEKYQNEVVNQKRNVDIDIQNNSHYQLIPIKSYDEMHSTFGGKWTGYHGDSEWCHTNGESTYQGWLKKDDYKFYILAKDNWKSIKPPKPESTNAYDDYGTSLIALLVDLSTVTLKAATLRWNHIIEPNKTIPGTSVDHAFSNFEQLNKLSGLDIPALIEKEINDEYKRLEKIQENANEIFQEVINYLVQEKSYYELTVEDIKLVFNEKYGLKNYDILKPSIQEITIPEGVGILDTNLFRNFLNLQKINLPKSLVKINQCAFYNCSTLEFIDLPENLSIIGAYAFSSCKNLKSITIPESVKEIKPMAFCSCRNLSKVQFEGNNIQYFRSGLFYGCENLVSIKIPDSVRVIENDVFYVCYKLTDIKLPENLRSLGDSVFYRTNIQKIEIPKSVDHIGDALFQDCTSLTDVVIKGKLFDLSSALFFGCENLKRVYLPNTITAIKSDSIFYQCNNLKELIFDGPVNDPENMLKYLPVGVEIKVQK